MNTNRRLILASRSPRRAQLLEEAGYRFEQIAPAFDDSDVELSSRTGETAATDLAVWKATSMAEELAGDNAIVLGCDTVLEKDEQLIGKPRDEHDARRILEMLDGSSHWAISGVCLVDCDKCRLKMFCDKAKVTFGKFDAEKLERYISSQAWRGKAGGYNLAELADEWPLTVQGDPTTVIGLPMRALAAALREFAPDLLPNP